MSVHTAGKNERIGVRATVWQRTLLQAASHAEGTTVSDFMLRHATQAAENLLADRRLFVVNTVAWDAFSAALDAPAKDVPGLEKLINMPTLLDHA